MNAGRGSIGRTLEMAIQSKNDKEETSAGAFGYEYGSAQKNSSPTRFAGQILGDQVLGGINGEFGAATNDMERPNVQDSLKKWAMQWSSGPFALGGPPPPPGEGMPPEEGA